MGAIFLLELASLSNLSESFAYKIEIHVSGPIESDVISEEDGRTALQLNTGSLTGPSGETGSAYATVDLATGKLALKVSATTPDDSAQSGMGLASIHIKDHLTFKLDTHLQQADIKFSMRVNAFPSCEALSPQCFTNAIIRLGDASDKALGLPLPNPKVLEATVSVVDGQVLPVEAFLSARVEQNNLLDVSEPSATIRLAMPQGVSFMSESGVFLESPPEEPLSGAPVSSDLNGDGKTDVVWRNLKTGEVAVWFMNGGSIGSSGFLGKVPADWKIDGVGDMNNDQMADIVWRNSKTGAVAVWFLNGNTVSSAGFPGSASLDWEMKAVGDMEGDGRADIVWHNEKTGAVSVWLMDGPIIIAFHTMAGVPVAWQILGVGDIDGNGAADIVWRHTNGVVAVWLMENMTIGSVKFLPGTGPEWQIAGLGDVDGNGSIDMIWRHSGNGKVGIWLLNGGGIDRAGFLSGMSLEWHIAQIGDVDGNGRADIIWHNRSTGQVAVWLMDGMTVAGTEFPGNL